MKAVQLTPGAGEGFYCENCLRDGAVVAALRRMGHDVTLMPLYLPLRAEQQLPDARTPVFFGGINVYLQQKFRLFRKTPRWLDKLFDAPWLLRRAASRAGMTDAALLGETTLSMLRGENGRQRKELDRLVDFLARGDGYQGDGPPDVIVLSSVLLAGVVRRIKAALGVPVVAWLQDEDGFVDGLGEPYAAEAWRLLHERGGEIDAFLAGSEYFAGVMRRRLDLPAERFHVAPLGIDPSGYAPAEDPPEPPAVGFLSQMMHSKGLAELAEAFVRLKRGAGPPGLRLHAAGGKTGADEEYIRGVRHMLDREGLAGDAEFLLDLDAAAKRRFLQTLSVLSVPTTHGEAFGLFIIESLACGVPVVQPRHGAAVEIVQRTGGGLLYPPGHVDALTAALGELLADPDRARELGRRGRQAVLRDYTLDAAATRVLDVLEGVVR